jgi:hypothetical protein
MSFLFPLYLFGAAAIMLPILLHLRRRPPKDHVEFSSLMFLEKTPERLTRRTRIERWLLLALRCLALLLLALMFGRPFLRSAASLPEMGAGQRVVVLIDASASMRRGDLWTRAVAEADAALKATGPADDVAVAVFQERVEVLRDFTTLANLPGAARADLFRQALAEAKITGPGWRSTRMGDALTEAAGLIADAAARRGMEDQEIVLISDFQEGADRDSLNRFAWPEDVAVRPVAVTVDGDAGNLALHLVAAGMEGEEAEAEGAPKTGDARQARRRVRLTNGRDSEAETFSLAWQGVPESKIEGFLPAGASRVMPVPPRADESRDGVLEISGDGQPFDNRVYLARAQPRPVDILYLAAEVKADDVGSPLFYLSRAMHRTASIDPAVSSATYETIAARPERLKSAQVVVLRCDAATPAALGVALADFAKAGGLVVAIANEGTRSETLQQVTGIAELAVAEAEVRDYAMLSALDFGHPVLAPFAQAQIRDFTKIHTWRHRVLTLPDEAAGQARVFARFDGGAPAWLEIPAPQADGGAATGRVFLFLSGWEPRESQLALSSKFVPLLYAMLGQAGFSAVAEPTRYVGHPIPLPAGETGIGVTLPDGSTVTPGDGATAFNATETPGFYTVTSRDALDQPQSRVHAINLAPSESRTEVADPAVALGDFGVRLESGDSEAPVMATEAQQRRVEAEEKESGQKLWKWFVVAALAILLLETWLAGRRGRVTTAAEATA